jgi:cytochrome c553
MWRRLLLGVGGLQVGMVGIALATSSYTDLRAIEPIHGDATAGARKAAVCQACHGANGTSMAPTFPRLAGQRPDYLYHRLVAFKQADANDPYYSHSMMKSQVTALSDADMRNLAVYFAAQKPTAPAANGVAPGELAEKGKAVFLNGDPPHGVPPCQGCHGAEAGGTPSRSGQYAAYPSMRGQYALYVTARLKSFRNGLPRDTTNDFIMGDVARGLDDESIEAVAAWIGSLAPAP